MFNTDWYKRIVENPSKDSVLRTIAPGASPVVDAKADALARSVVQAGVNAQREAEFNEAIADTIDVSGAEVVESKDLTNGVTVSAYARNTVPPNWPQRVEDSGLQSPYQLDPSQEAATRVLVSSQYACLIGAAGTGKTTLVKHILGKFIYGDAEMGIEPIGIRQLSDAEGPSIALCAFTGIATQVLKSNLPSWMGDACKTVHTLLEYKPAIIEKRDASGAMKTTQVFLPTRDRSNKLNHNIIVVDEASMLGLDLWHNLLAALRPGTRVVLIGDLNQLRPVADQTMFAYALGEAVRLDRRWKVAELTTIHRQSEAAANRIIEAAHQVLNGENITFDDPKINLNWRVIGFKLKTPVADAHREIVAIADALRKKNIDASIDPATPPFYDPHSDRIMTAGNGYDENNTIRYVQQAGINDTLCRVIQPPSEENPIYIIDAGTEQKRFAVGHRVMALKNEPPSTRDRVTNGMTGRVTLIEPNPKWPGVRESVGPEQKVQEWRRHMAKVAFGEEVRRDSSGLPENFDFQNFDLIEEEKEEGEEESFNGGPASHIVTVLFDNGATRSMGSKAQVANIQLAYATTVHKAQGSQCDTAIIVVHHAVKSQLSREWLYTAITRAKKRVVILYTDWGLRTAIQKQQIFGKTLAEKIFRYQRAMLEGTGGGRSGVVNLTIEGESEGE